VELASGRPLLARMGVMIGIDWDIRVAFYDLRVAEFRAPTRMNGIAMRG